MGGRGLISLRRISQTDERLAADTRAYEGELIGTTHREDYVDLLKSPHRRRRESVSLRAELSA